jgi:DNA gyrase subunit A
MHLLRILDMPQMKFKDKGTPVDNISNFDSSIENIIYIDTLSSVLKKKFFFGTDDNLIKQVDGSLFDVSKKTTASTKLNDGSRIILMNEIEDSDTIVIQSDKDYFLRIKASDIPEKKKAALGVRAMHTGNGESIRNYYIVHENEAMSIKTGRSELHLDKLKVSDRDKRGSRH